MGEKGTLGEYWIKHYAFVAPGSPMQGTGWQHNQSDPSHAFNSDTGQNAHWDNRAQQWKDSATGQPLSTAANARASD